MFRTAAIRSASAVPVVFGGVQFVQWKQPRNFVQCETDYGPLYLAGAMAAGAAVMYALGPQGGAKPAQKSFETRLRKNYVNSAQGRAVLSECAVAHPDLVKSSIGEQHVGDVSLAVANHIRDMWAGILSEQFHFPKGFFIEKSAKDQIMAGNLNESRRGQSKNMGNYKINIAYLKHNKVAVAYGVDVLAEKMDRNGDGVMDFHEFATMVLLSADLEAEKHGSQKRNKAAFCKLLYTILDDDQDGNVTKEEFESFMVMASKIGIAKKDAGEDIPALWQKYDADGNGILSYSEFLAFAKVCLELSQFPGDFPSA